MLVSVAMSQYLSTVSSDPDTIWSPSTENWTDFTGLEKGKKLINITQIFDDFKHSQNSQIINEIIN